MKKEGTKEEVTLESLSTGQVHAEKPDEVKTSEEKREWHVQFWTKIGLIIIGVLIVIYGGYVATRVLLEYRSLLERAQDIQGLIFPSGVALMVVPIIIAGLVLVLSAAKLLTKPNEENKESAIDKWLEALNPVLRAVQLYLRSKSS